MRGTNDIVVMTEKWFAKAPSLPTNARQILVKIAPIISLIFGILGILGSLAGVGLLTAFAPFAAMGAVSSYGSGFIAALVLLISSVLMLAAFPGLRARSLKGWNLLFWSEVINLVGTLIAFQIISGIIGALIGFYLLFQIKSFYK